MITIDHNEHQCSTKIIDDDHRSIQKISTNYIGLSQLFGLNQNNFLTTYPELRGIIHTVKSFKDADNNFLNRKINIPQILKETTIAQKIKELETQTIKNNQNDLFSENVRVGINNNTKENIEKTLIAGVENVINVFEVNRIKKYRIMDYLNLYTKNNKNNEIVKKKQNSVVRKILMKNKTKLTTVTMDESKVRSIIFISKSN